MWRKTDEGDVRDDRASAQRRRSGKKVKRNPINVKRWAVSVASFGAAACNKTEN